MRKVQMHWHTTILWTHPTMSNAKSNNPSNREQDPTPAEEYMTKLRSLTSEMQKPIG